MSCNYLTPRGIEVKNSDTLSEVSESGTATSGFNSNWGSREELRDFVAKHGLKDISDLYQDRFRVDRKKLEQMLSGELHSQSRLVAKLIRAFKGTMMRLYLRTFSLRRLWKTLTLTLLGPTNSNWGLNRRRILT
jgi:hypothetical protein